ncbi:MAG: high-potential iron-sulfur protein [Woeseiaceae bacterium]
MKKTAKAGQWMSRITRRRFFASAGAAAAVVTSGLQFAEAEDALVRLEENNPTAKALNYVHDAKTVDAAKRFSDRFCNNCALFAGDSDDEWAGCSIFPGKAVANQGWCSVWAPKQNS